MHHQPKGAYTGEVSPPMLAGLCRYVIVGHSERRHHFGESDREVNLKVRAALEAGLSPIVCVGETLQQRDSGKAAQVVSDQVRAALDSVSDVGTLAVAYEPIWAIGTGMAATPQHAAEIMGGVLGPTLAEIYGAQAAGAVPLLYGGSVTSENVAGFASQACVHGVLVGGASLRADQFVEIVKVVGRAKATS